MEPHVYEASALAYKGLTIGDVAEHQSILVSGESGAGKTETVKICLDHIASTQRGPSDELYDSGDELNNDPVVQRIVDSNPLLEAFGNAKTRRNDNSSRFGKYLQLQFDRSGRTGGAIDTGNRSRRCALVGSKCEVYLLEKNRVVQHEASERNFHIFYQLLSNPKKTSFWSKLAHADPTSFAYVGTRAGKDDAYQFEETLQALELINVKGDSQSTLMQALCVVLQLGNLGFAADPADHDRSVVSTGPELADLAELMNVTELDLTQALTLRTFSTPSETHKVPLNAAAAKEACDALAKEIYQKIFLWLVQKINQATSIANEQDEETDSGRDLGLIGLLDIFGFETFGVNRFEQLCINYANEKLQQKFTQDVFRLVQEEYHAEGIPLKEIYYDDNTNVLDLIEGRPTGLLALLNEECIRPKGNAMDYVQKALKANHDSPCLVVHQTDRLSFGIHHYAGTVMYDAEGFVLRNQDTLPTDLQECAEKCSNDIVRAARSEPLALTKTDQIKSLSKKRGRPSHRESNLMAPTVSTKYKNQLQDLMVQLRQTRSRYIRCIKPNSQKAPLLMENKPVVDQLRCAGVVAGITITRSVFPNSLENTAVLARYASPSDLQVSGKTATAEQLAEACKALLHNALYSKRMHCKDTGEVANAFVVGKTKTFFRAGALEWLEMNRLSALDAEVTEIQRMARGWLVRLREQQPNSRRSRKKQREEQAEREQWEWEEARRVHKRKQQALKEEHNAELNELKRQIEQLQEAIAESDRSTKAQVAAFRERQREMRHEMDRYEEEIEVHNSREQRWIRVVEKEQKKKLEENKKLIEYLRKEAKKGRKAQEKAQAKRDKLQDQKVKLQESNSTLCVDFDDLNEQAIYFNEKMEDVSCVLDKAIKQNKQLRRQVFMAQEEYMDEVEVRSEYQKAMARIMEMIQKRCPRGNGRQDALITGLDCQAECKSIMCVLEAKAEPNMILSDVSESSSNFW